VSTCAVGGICRQGDFELTFERNSQSTLAVMKEEFERGREICKRINDGKANWEELFEPNDVFAKYSVFLQGTWSPTPPS